MKAFILRFFKLKELKVWTFLVFILKIILVSTPLSCKAQDTVTINGPNTICKGQNATISVASGYRSYLWSTNDSTQSITITQPGTYAVTVVDTAKRTLYGTKTLTISDLPNPVIGGEPYVCNQNPTTLYINGNYPSVKWSDGTIQNQITIGMPSTISVTVTDGNGCQGIASVIIRDGSKAYNALPDTVRLCEGDSIELDATVLDASNPNDFRYVWLPMDSMMAKMIIRSTDTGRVNVLAIGKCVSYDTVYVQVLPKPEIDFGASDTSICKGESILLKPNINNDFDFKWSDGSKKNELTVKQAGNYALTVTYGTCRDSANIKISMFDEILEVEKDVSSCDSAINLVAPLNRFIQTVKWNTGSSAPSIEVTKSGEYIATVSNGRCNFKNTYNVELKKIPQFDLGNDTLICLEYASTNVVLNANQAFDATYKWQDGSDKSNFTVKETGKYWVEVSNECGTFSDTIDFTIKECFQIYVPNTINPNSDLSENRVLKLYPSPEVSKIKSFQVYNRWGNLIFATNEFDRENTAKYVWDGRTNNQPAAPDVYVYFVEYYNSRGELLVKKGDVTILK